MDNISIIKEKCCGCRGCGSICTKDAISFEDNDEGFFYPVIDEEKCVNCGLCLRVCPIATRCDGADDGTAFAAWNKNEEVLKESSSGGLFSAFAEMIIKDRGCVCGCAYDDELVPHHIIVDTIDDLKKLRGSKYVESDITGIYQQVEERLKTQKVLFVGVPCQVAGLKNYIKAPKNNLLTIDIICHGVPSRKMFREYLNWEEKKRDAKITAFDFRSKKKHSWSLTYCMNYEKNGKLLCEEKMASFSPYYAGFLASQAYRNSCYECLYANDNRVGDITLGDFWGVDRTYPELFNDEGVSCVLVNTEKGQKVLESINDGLHLKKVDRKAVVENNGQLHHPSKKPSGRDEVYKELNESGFAGVAQKFMVANYSKADIIKNQIPQKIRNKIKRLIRR